MAPWSPWTRVSVRRSVIRVLVTSFRLHHTDGVSVEAAKLERIFTRWGWEVGELAGAYGSATGRTAPQEMLPSLEAAGKKHLHRYIAPALGIDHAVSLRQLGLWEGRRSTDCHDLLDRHATEAHEAISAAFEDFRPDLVVVENVFGLPLNPGYSEAMRKSLEEYSIPALLRHHDLIWQRPEFSLERLDVRLADRIAPNFPPRLANAVHLAINRLSVAELEARGYDAFLLYNGFEFPDADAALADRNARRAKARDALSIPQECMLLVQPTRAIERKGVPDSIDLGRRLADRVNPAVRLLVCGPPEDGYDVVLTELAEDLSAGARSTEVDAPFRLILGMGKLPIDLCYEAADFIVFPSRWEGFGNPVIESIIWAKPLVVREYPVLTELLDLGLSFIAWDPDPLQGVLAWMELDEAAKLGVLAENLRIAGSRLSVESEAQGIEDALRRLGIQARLGEHDLEGARR